MSLTTSPGFVDARRWMGMAAAMVAYLDQWLACPEDRRTLPRGTFASAIQFFTHVLKGIRPDHPQAKGTIYSPMAGMSNLSIALGVLSAFDAWKNASREDIERAVVSYHRALGEIVEGGSTDEASLSETVTELRAFFQELYRQGDLARHASP